MDFTVNDVEYFVFCQDPSYGGECNTAISIGYIDKKDNQVLCWLSAYSPKGYEEFIEFTYGNIRKFREKYTEAIKKPIYIVYETGSRWDASVLAIDIKKMSDESVYYQNIHFIIDYYKTQKSNETSRIVPGINATKQRLNDMVSYFARGLKQNKFYISNKFDTYSLDVNSNASTELNDLKNELLEFRHYEENQNKKYEANKKRPKNNSGKSFRKQDDRAIVYGMLAYWIEQLEYNSYYIGQLKYNKGKSTF